MNGNILALALMVVVVACSRPSAGERSSGRLSEFVLATSRTFPALVEARPAADDPTLLDALGMIAVAPNGVTAVFSEPGGELSIQMFAANGHLQSRVSRRGQGPGEFEWVSYMRFVDTDLVVLAPRRPVAMRFDLHGRFLDESRLQATSLSVLGVADGIADIVTYDASGFAGIALEHIGTRSARPFLSTRNRHVAEAAIGPPGAPLVQPPYVRTGRFGVIGVGSSYQLAVFDTTESELGVFGRTVPATPRGPRGLAQMQEVIKLALKQPSPRNGDLQRRLDTLDREPVPHFGRGALGIDERGRLWVVGRIGDSTFADAFADTTFLGRHILPCLLSPGGASVNGSHIALRCLGGDDETYRLHLYRMAEPN